MEGRKFYRCDTCGNLFGVVNDSGVVPVCCNNPMSVLVPNSTDAAGEKHVPALARDGKFLRAQIGSVAHPMAPEHYIPWIMALQGNRVQRVALSPNEAPVAQFTLVSADEPVMVYGYCNLHGLWVAEG